MKEHAVEPIAAFQSWKKNMVRYGLVSGLGRLFSDDSKRSFLYDLGNFLFLAGSSNKTLWTTYRDTYGLKHKIIISEEADWQEMFQQETSLKCFNRYAFQAQADVDVEHLAQLIQALSQQAEIQAIDSEMFQRLQDEAWSEDLKGAWQTFSDFQAAGGYGFVVICQERVCAGISTGLVYQGAIEIEIATAPSHRRQGFARSLAAQMMLESCRRGVLPLWDAHNEASKNLAEQLGYRLMTAYPAYEEK
ncbi:GNAT family N-acetyltransferase [Streptococcus respiraculi]|uniref:GNAT family N-acetyltransferase n=1 Tax=Streptococcus respiraculi TaxID=2021971 RepID=UPI000E76568F|nr:GNAT family N-acetyltransferase [Streptococcus respiraculi]